MSVPCILISGSQSGVGKTSISVALVRALARRGLKVAAFKVGPDFLDPTYLSIASGARCYNLDGWMMGREYAAGLFHAKSAGADIAVVEGVMGLFDGSSPDTIEGSSAEIAALVGAPVLLVVNTHGMARSIAALVKGYAEFDAKVHVAGVIANMAGSKSHGALLSEALWSSSLPPLLGAVPRGSFPELPGRHLGLVTADGTVLSEEILNALADALEANVDLDRVLEIAKSASAGMSSDGCLGDVCENETTTTRLRLGVARDEAFHFYYADTLEALEATGFELAAFSLVHDGALPANLSGLYLGGGYPELHAKRLSENKHMLESVRQFAASGKPVYGECGGLMYLSRHITAADGTRHEMCGLLPFGVRMLNGRGMPGYIEARLEEDSLWGTAGTVFRGHEFHYSEPIGEPDGTGDWNKSYAITRRRTGAREAEGYSRGNVLASYAHLHFASSPGAARAFYAKCAACVQEVERLSC